MNWTRYWTIAIAAALSAGALPARADAQTAKPPVSVYGTVPEDPDGVRTDAARPVTPADTASSKRGEFVVAPMPMVNPTLENGLVAVVGYLYRIDADDHTTPPSATFAAGFKTSNGSWMTSVVQSLHLDHDRFRLLGLAAYSDLNYAFYGIGQEAGDAGISVELNQAGSAGMFEGLVRVAPNFYLGARYQIVRMTVTTKGLSIPDGPTLPGRDTDLRTASLGPRVDFDTRDNPFYPRRGTQIRGIANLYGSGVGGQRSYQGYEAWVNRYHGVGARNVLALHAGACGMQGDAPFYDLCLLGKSQDLRGYTVGQYRDDAMIAAQAEWRTELWWRFGAVAFAGTGEVAPDFGSLTWKELLPGYGAGLRFTLAKRNHVNLRVDYAWGRNSSALYIGVIEAF